MWIERSGKKGRGGWKGRREQREEGGREHRIDLCYGVLRIKAAVKEFGTEQRERFSCKAVSDGFS